MPMPTRLTGIAATILLLGCGGDTLAPSDVVGDYRLVRFANHEPPALAYSSGGCNTSIQSGSLNLGADGRLTLLLNTTLDCSAVGQAPYDVVRGHDGTYEPDGATLRIVLWDGDSIITQGTVRDSTVSLSIEPEISPLVFRRAP
jgi:hypothetical protein